MNKFVKYIMPVLATLAFVGCSNSRQHMDPSWTTKPSMLQVVYTVPVIPDSLELPEPMKTISDWIWNNVDNTLKFNAASHYKLSEISKDLVSYSSLEAEGENIQVPKLNSMSDSADVYLIYDNFKFESFSNFVPGAAGAGMGGATGFTVGMVAGTSHGCVRISASYAYYEVKSGKRLDYGFLEESHCAEDKAFEHDWQNALRDMVMHSIEKTPVTQY